MPPDGVWTTCRHMQSLGELQQLDKWSVHAEIRGILAQRHTMAGLNTASVALSHWGRLLGSDAGTKEGGDVGQGFY